MPRCSAAARSRVVEKDREPGGTIYDVISPATIYHQTQTDFFYYSIISLFLFFKHGIRYWYIY